MYDIKQFRPTLYVVLLLGVLGFSLAAQSPGLWIIATGFILFHAWLMGTNSFSPLPRAVANGLTLVILLYVVRQVVLVGSTGAVLAIGQFLVFLQLIKLFEYRANRDSAQLLVLSLLLMVAAMISTASLLFATVLVIYLFLALYSCLLLHLKVEADTAKAVLADAQLKVNPATLRQDQRYLSSSMRRLTALVSTSAILAAVMVFLFFPRGGTGALFNGLQFRPSQTLTGFNDQVSFQQVARITQNEEKVADVRVSKNGVPVEGTDTLLLRGVTLDVYGGNDPETRNAWKWFHSPSSVASGPVLAHESHTMGKPFGDDKIEQVIRLQATGTKALFAVAGPWMFQPSRLVNQFAYADDDQTLQTLEPLYQAMEYTVVSTGVIKGSDDGGSPEGPQSRIDPKIAEFARLPEVCGTNAQGVPLAQARGSARVSPLDEQIALNMERYLQSHFEYTLDLTDARKIMQGQDPMVAFLYDLKRGHCEYFAGAMTLMCQSLGMQARMVVGFKCDEFNTVGGFYEVRQSHAHAWVEVLCADHTWKTFDPTSGRESGPRNKTAWMRVKHFFDFLEYKWATSVVAYDGDSRDNLIERIDNNLTNSALRGNESMSNLRNWLQGDMFITLSSKVLGGLVGFMVFVVFVAILWFLIERWRLHRRAARIGLDALPPADQLRLARQLGFYADLMDLLERRHIHRPRHLTPMEFSKSLTFLPSEAYETIQRLTRIFYRVRFGEAQVSGALRRRLDAVIDQLRECMPRRVEAEGTTQ